MIKNIPSPSRQLFINEAYESSILPPLRTESGNVVTIDPFKGVNYRAEENMFNGESNYQKLLKNYIDEEIKEYTGFTFIEFLSLTKAEIEAIVNVTRIYREEKLLREKESIEKAKKANEINIPGLEHLGKF